MRHLSSFTKRVLRFLVAMLLMMHGASYAAVFSPEMERFGECSQVMTVHAVELKERAASRDLYYMRVRPWGDSTDERMLRSQRMQGAIFGFPIAADAHTISDQARVTFTGTVYKRRPSMFQRVLGGARGELFYVVELQGEQALLSVSAFYKPPLAICGEASGS